MSFFQYYFDITDVDSREVAVCCPFEHHTSSGLAYKETNPSAHVNLSEGLFHCKVCGTGYNEHAFIKKIYNTKYASAVKLARAFNNDETKEMWDREVTINQAHIDLAHSFNITDEVISELSLGSMRQQGIEFPVFMYGKLLDIRRYDPTSSVKVKSRRGAMNGLVIPYDIWVQQPKERITLVCAGEKDMAVARSQGFNAITITGGEKALPICLSDFFGRHVVIVYDNDDAGKEGAVKLAIELQPYAASVRVVTKFHEVCAINKEDITDYFNKYGKTKEDLIQCIESTPEFTIPPDYYNKTKPLMTLLEASRPNNTNRVVRSNIQVVATSESAYSAPTVVLGEKFKTTESDTTSVMAVKELREWSFEEHTAKDLLHLVDNNFKESDIKKNMRDMLKIPYKERYVKLTPLANATVFKCYVTDMFETTDSETVPMEYLAYSIGTKLESGKKYLVTHKLVPHPYKGQQLTMIILNAEQANDSVSEFKLTDSVKHDLSIVAGMTGTVEQKIHELTERVKGLLGYDGNNLLIETIDLAYHTPLQFNLGGFLNERAYLDTMVVTESRVGKSSTVNALRAAYNLGIITSLAGNSATVSGLIGGSNKVSGGGYQTRAGLIPQNHKGLIVFEEFGKCRGDIVTELTDIRSSNEVRITRVSGTLSLPAMVRMISLTNVKNTGQGIKPIASYPNGVSIITELIGSAEDIARYDIMLILNERGNGQVDPFWRPIDPLPPSVYNSKIRWVWSRTPEQIIINSEVGHYLINKSNELNGAYDSHIKIFGTEGWKKLARLSIAIAGYLVSTDDTYEKLIVTKEHVDHAVDYFIRIYDNHTFRLKEYVNRERKYSTIDEPGLRLLQQLYTKAPSMLLQLEQEAKSNRNMLMSASGLDAQMYGVIMNKLIRGMFVQLSHSEIYPTERFRLGMAKIERNTEVREVGDIIIGQQEDTMDTHSNPEPSGY